MTDAAWQRPPSPCLAQPWVFHLIGDMRLWLRRATRQRLFTERSGRLQDTPHRTGLNALPSGPTFSARAHFSRRSDLSSRHSGALPSAILAPPEHSRPRSRAMEITGGCLCRAVRYSISAAGAAAPDLRARRYARRPGAGRTQRDDLDRERAQLGVLRRAPAEG